MKSYNQSFQLVQTLRNVSLRIVLFLLLFIGGLVGLYAQLSPPRMERVERIDAFSADTLETKYGFVRFEQGNGRYGFDLGAEKLI